MMDAHLNSRIDTDSFDRCQRYRELSQEYQAYALENGIEILPFRDASLPLFSQLPEAHQDRILRALECATRICRNVRKEAGNSWDPMSLVWGALREFKLRPPSDLFSRMEANSIVEIHSPEGVQLFCNFEFYRFCSYSLEELHSGTWSTLYEREFDITEKMFSLAGEIFAPGGKRLTMPTGIPRHAVRECQSPKLLTVELDMQWVAPLFREGTGNPEAALVIESARLLSAGVGVPARAKSRRPRAAHATTGSEVRLVSHLSRLEH